MRIKNTLLIAGAIIIMSFIFIIYRHIENKNSVSKQVSYQDITAQEARELLSSDKGVLLLDVRTLEEYNTIHIPNSVLITLDQLDSKAIAKIANKDTTILVYCRSGNRSVTASLILVELGYTNVYNLGGIIDWPYEVITNN